jgi:hypothetical protein
MKVATTRLVAATVPTVVMAVAMTAELRRAATVVVATRAAVTDGPVGCLLVCVLVALADRLVQLPAANPAVAAKLLKQAVVAKAKR